MDESCRIYFRFFNVANTYNGGYMDGQSYLIQFREWTMWIMEAGILYILIAEYNYDKEKDEVKKQRRTKTTKKTSTLPTGEVITEENVESVEGSK